MSPMGKQEGKLTKVYVVYYSMCGYIHHVAQAVKKGVDSVPGCKGVLYQVSGSPGKHRLWKKRAQVVGLDVHMMDVRGFQY